MSRGGTSKFELKRWAFTLTALIAVVGQLALTFVPLAEASEGRSMASHVERAGTSAHYAHNDANCAACQARTLHGLASRPQLAVPVRAEMSDAIGFVAAAIVAPGRSSPNSRAPPTV